MKKQIRASLKLITVVAVLFLGSCKKDPPPPTDQHPTWSKKVSSISFTSPTGISKISAGQKKDAGKITITSISSTTVNLTFTFSGAGAAAVAQFSTNGAIAVDANVVNNKFTISLPVTPGTANLDLMYIATNTIPSGIVDGSQITLTLTSFSTSEANVVLPGNGLLPSSINLDKVNVPVTFTAVINPTGSYDASITAVDKSLLGRSVAKAFVLNITTAGTAEVEVLGILTDGGLPITHYWINGSDNSDLGVVASTLGSIVPKTLVVGTFSPRSFIVNLRVGINVICFKTAAFASQITAGTKIGLKVTGANGVSYTNSGYTADPIKNVAAKIKVVNQWLGGVYINPTTDLIGSNWGDYNIIPQDESGNFDINGFPSIVSVALDTKYYNSTYPKLFFSNSSMTPVGFQQDFKITGAGFGSDININGSGVVFASTLVNNTINYIDHIIFLSGPAVQTVKSALNYAVIRIVTNVYNSDNMIWGPHAVGFDPAKGGWKFVGNPEMELYTGDTPSKRIY